MFAQSDPSNQTDEHKFQAAPTLTDLPSELLYAIFDHVETWDLFTLARVSRRLNAVAMCHYLGPWREVERNYSLFGEYLTGAPRTFSGSAGISQRSLKRSYDITGASPENTIQAYTSTSHRLPMNVWPARERCAVYMQRGFTGSVNAWSVYDVYPSSAFGLAGNVSVSQ
ncbi:hypothetical protein EDD18DRAFT_1191455 [Armillaria luteobubalina]|uniref:F-box domain-containing protein n=1 Tax=Armillaria luteobubalina TaxID=153913 RepID=A0AA39UHV4_9AGAR|nr:hypothetical protein EDD18DRAFT_1191455 [Armillaria luteobubalina]